MKNESTISAHGQTTVPADIRKRFDWLPGTRLNWYVEGDRLMVRAAKCATAGLPADDGPLTARQVKALRKDANKHLPTGKTLSKNTLF